MDRLSDLRYCLDALICLLNHNIFDEVARIEIRHMLSYVLDELNKFYY